MKKPDDLPDELLPLWELWEEDPAPGMTFHQWLQRMVDYLERFK